VTSPRPRGVLDTSTVLGLPLLRDPALLPDEQLIAAVTLAELSVGPLVATSDQERARRLLQVQQAENDFEVLAFDAAAARAFALVASAMRRAGRKTSARTYNALIAATALANGLPLYTANPGDLAGIDGLEVVEVTFP
jgi:tRNA(fMet)-specific endonuclease VapC